MRRGALATINSVVANAACPERLLFHVPSLDAENRARWAKSMQDTFENVHLYQYSKARAVVSLPPDGSGGVVGVSMSSPCIQSDTCITASCEAQMKTSW